MQIRGNEFPDNLKLVKTKHSLKLHFCPVYMQEPGAGGEVVRALPRSVVDRARGRRNIMLQQCWVSLLTWPVCPVSS